VPLGSHPGIYELSAKYGRVGQTPNPFFDPEGYLYEIALNEQGMELRLEEQRRAAGGRQRGAATATGTDRSRTPPVPSTRARVRTTSVPSK
jgi:hypothetical protein